MPHEVFVCDLIAVKHKVVLPDHCPKCKVTFEPGSKNVKLWSLKPIFHQVRLTKVTACGKSTDVFESISNPQQPVQEGDWDRLPAIFKCANCHHTLAKYHRRTWDFAEMDKELAGQLRTLLYDSNVLDQDILSKVWNIDYPGMCFACGVEAVLGTEECPHPVDPRRHSCVKGDG
jgi:hypothetical protein